MTGRRISFSNPRKLLTQDSRLDALRDRVSAIDADLSELAAMSEAERQEAAGLRDGVLEKFRRLSEV